MGLLKVVQARCLQPLVLGTLCVRHGSIVITDAGTVIQVFGEAFDVQHAADKRVASGVIHPLPKVTGREHGAGITRRLGCGTAVDDRLEQLADCLQLRGVAVLRLLHGSLIHVGVIQAGEILIQLALIHRYNSVGSIVPHFGSISVSRDFVVLHQGAEQLERAL